MTAPLSSAPSPGRRVVVDLIRRSWSNACAGLGTGGNAATPPSGAPDPGEPARRRDRRGLVRDRGRGPAGARRLPDHAADPHAASSAGGSRRDRENKAYLPGVELPRDLRIEPAERGPRARGLRVPRRALARAGRGDRRARARPASAAARAGRSRSPRASCRPTGSAPTVAALATRSATGASPCVGGPAHAREMVTEGAGLVAASLDERARAARSPTSSCAPASCASSPTTRSASSSRAWPRTPRRWPRAPPRRRASTPRAPPPGTSSHEVWRYAERQGARPESLIGLAGTGDLVGDRARAAEPQPARGRAARPRACRPPRSPSASARPSRRSTSCRCSPRALDRAGVEAPVTDALRAPDRGRAAARGLGRPRCARRSRRRRASGRAARPRRAWEQARAWVRRRSVAATDRALAVPRRAAEPPSQP